MSLPPEEPPGLEVARGKGNGGLLSGLTPGVNSLTLSGVPMTQTPVVARMSEGFREPPVVGNREEGQGGKHQSSTEVGGGAAAVVETVALLERPDAPLPPPDESPPEDSEPYEPSEMLEADEGPDEIDLLFEELNREDPEAPVEEIDSLVPEISKMKVEPAEVSAGGEPGNLFKSDNLFKSEKIKVSRVSAQDGPDSGEKHIERSPTSGEFIVRNVSLTHLLKVKEDQHLGVVEAIKEELSNVPVDPTNGFIQGQVLRLLQEHREDLEEELEAVTTAKMEEERRVCQLRVCSAQADGSGGEEQLQTVTVPLHKVRMEKEKWYDSMLAEYKSLTAETKAIRPVKRSEIDPEAELVPGKLVCVIKAGGRYKCRAVICGNLASPEADPMPSLCCMPVERTGF